MKKDVVLITGASSGIGLALAEIFAKNGHDLILAARNRDRLEKTCKLAQTFGVNSEFFICDLRNISEVKKLAEFALKKHVTVLVNNAGLGCPGKSLEELSQDEIQDILNLNLFAPIMLTKFLYDHFLSLKKSAVININSMVSREVKKFRTIYSASKSGLRGFSESLALEAYEKNILVSNIYPTAVKTRAGQENAMSAEFVAEKIYEAFRHQKPELIIDGRKLIS